jgi:hypothetical protein
MLVEPGYVGEYLSAELGTRSTPERLKKNGIPNFHSNDEQINVEFDEGPILDRPKHSIVPTTWHKELRSVASPVLKIAGSRLQIRKVQFLQILYATQSQPQDSLKGSNQLNLAFDLALDLSLLWLP